jgi:hypothetical protein
MLGVLVVIFCPNRVADLGFSARQSAILFIVSLRVLGIRLELGGTRLSTASGAQRMTLPVWRGARS